MDVGYLLRILYRRKWLILAAMLTAAAATYFFIGQKPERYKASVIVSTGIVNYQGINADNSDVVKQQYQVENAFSNLIEFSQSRSTLKLLTIAMLRHDLLGEGSIASKPFRTPDNNFSDFTDEEKNALLDTIVKIDLDSLGDVSFNKEFDYLLDKIARAYGYDYDAIWSCLQVERRAGTDYLTIEIVTENPALSQYMANEYAARFLICYQNLAVKEKKKKVEFFSELSVRKKTTLDSITDLRYSYLRSRSLPSGGRQGGDLITQISDFENARDQAESRRDAAIASLRKLDDFVDRRGSRDATETKNRIVDKSDTEEYFEKVRQLTQKSLAAGGKDPEIEAELAEAKQQLEESVRSSARNLGKQKDKSDPKRTQEDIRKERASYNLDRTEAENTISQIDAKIATLKSRLGGIVVNDEYSTNLLNAETRAQEEFNAINDQLMAATLDLSKSDNPLSIAENAQLPEQAEPNRQLLLSGLAALVAGSLTTILLFLLAYMDGSMQSPELFKRYTGNLPLLGSVNSVPVQGLDLNRIFSTNGEMPKFNLFRESLRKIRSLILKDQGSHIFLIVSTKNKEGKTFTMHALAHSLAANNKHVLMLDTNFKTPLPETYTDRATGNSALLNEIMRENSLVKVFQLKTPLGTAKRQKVDIIGNHGLQKSPSEVLDPKTFTRFLNDLRAHYDYIFLESAALNDYSDAQELLPFVDKVIAIFNAHSVVSPQDKISIQYLQSLGEKFAGAILTDVDARNMN